MMERRKEVKGFCTGCGACANSCPKKAIQMIGQEEGFLRPVRLSNCVNCGKCKQVCPMYHKVKREEKIECEAYAMYDKAYASVTTSSSGGIFLKIARYVIEELEGVVFGAVYTTDHVVEIVRAETIEEVERMAGSKYVASYTKKTYQEAEEELKKNRYVLYSGLPCQIAGLHQYLGKEYERLWSVEVLCHGAASQELFQKYIKEMERRYRKKIIKINQRDFSQEWNPLIMKRVRITFADQTTKVLREDFDPFLSLYIRELSYQKACYACSYVGLERNADITIGDYGGLGIVHRFVKPDYGGVSMVLLNTKKGKEFMKQLSGLYQERREIEETILWNTCLYRAVSIPKKRNEFLQDSISMSGKELFNKYFYHNMPYLLRAGFKRIMIKVIGVNRLARLLYWKRKGREKQSMNRK